MSRIILVRHAKASFMEDDYDKLSEPGFHQSRLLGAHLAVRRPQIDAVFVGPRRRHEETWQLASDAAAAVGGSWPAPTPIPEFDEHKGEELIKAVLPELTQEDPELLALVEKLGEGGPDYGRHFQRMFERITRRWARGELSAPGVESWQEFRARVARGLTFIMKSTGRGETALVFTSAGAIAAATGHVLELSDVKTLELSWAFYNASLSEILFSGSRVSLASLNRTPHLTDPDTLSYR